MPPFKKTSGKQLGELLLERGILDHKQLERAVSLQKEKNLLLGEALVELGFTTEEDIAQALTSQFGFPYLPLSNYDIDSDVLKTVPENVCRQYCLIPIGKIGKSLTLVMANPLNQQAVEDMEMICACSIQIFVSTTTDIRIAIEKYYRGKK
jgi:type IV pilus assembly protein PilB